jgi:hypothetical protein
MIPIPQDLVALLNRSPESMSGCSLDPKVKEGIESRRTATYLSPSARTIDGSLAGPYSIVRLPSPGKATPLSLW